MGGGVGAVVGRSVDVDVDLANVVTVCLSKEGGGAFLEDDGAEVLAKFCGDMNILFIPGTVCMVDVVWFFRSWKVGFRWITCFIIRRWS